MRYAQEMVRVPPLRNFNVAYEDTVDHIQAHFMFETENGGLLFRRYINDNPENKTHIIAQYAPGHWKWVKERPEEGFQ